MYYLITEVINRIFTLLYILIVARVILSFFPVPINRFTKPILRFIYDVTDAILAPFRNLLPPVMIGAVGLDLSPLIAILVLNMLQWLIIEVIGFFAF